MNNKLTNHTLLTKNITIKYTIKGKNKENITRKKDLPHVPCPRKFANEKKIVQGIIKKFNKLLR